MNELPKRKHIRIEDYDYSTPGVQTRAVGIVSIFLSQRSSSVAVNVAHEVFSKTGVIL